MSPRVLGVAIVGQVALIMKGDGTYILALMTNMDRQTRFDRGANRRVGS